MSKITSKILEMVDPAKPRRVVLSETKQTDRRISMIAEVLRLNAAGVSRIEIANDLGISEHAVRGLLRRFKAYGEGKYAQEAKSFQQIASEGDVTLTALRFGVSESDLRRGGTIGMGRHDNLQVATLLHLLDLKLAGHSPSRTEEIITAGDSPRNYRVEQEPMSYCGSPGAMSVDFA